MLTTSANLAHASQDRHAGPERAHGRSLHHHAMENGERVRHGRQGPIRKGMSGIASYYADRFHGRKTSSGHLYYKDAWTAAHRTIPLGTLVRVTNDHNGRSVVVQITDRGPYSKHRVIDLSRAAAHELGMGKSGTAPVHLEMVKEYPKTK
jgi:rare lipoprotein A